MDIETFVNAALDACYDIAHDEIGAGVTEECMFIALDVDDTTFEMVELDNTTNTYYWDLDEYDTGIRTIENYHTTYYKVRHINPVNRKGLKTFYHF